MIQQGRDLRTATPRQATLHPRDLILVASPALSRPPGPGLNTLLRVDLHLPQGLLRLSSPGLPRQAPTPPPPLPQLRVLPLPPPRLALDLQQARPPTASLRQTSRHPLPPPSRGQLPPLTPGLAMLPPLTTRPLTRPTPGPGAPRHPTTTRLHSQDIRDIHQLREDIQVDDRAGYALFYHEIIRRISTDHRLPWWLPAPRQLPAWPRQLPPSSSSPARTSSVWIPGRATSRLPLQASSGPTWGSHEPSPTRRLPGLRPEQIRPPTSWLWSSPALVISYSNCSSKQSYGNLKKSMNVSYSVSYVCTCTYINIGY